MQCSLAFSTQKMQRARLLLLATPLALAAPTPGPRPPPALDPWSTALAAEGAPKPSSSVAAEVAAAAKEAVAQAELARAKAGIRGANGAAALLAQPPGDDPTEEPSDTCPTISQVMKTPLSLRWQVWDNSHPRTDCRFHDRECGELAPCDVRPRNSCSGRGGSSRSSSGLGYDKGYESSWRRCRSPSARRA